MTSGWDKGEVGLNREWDKARVMGEGGGRGRTREKHYVRNKLDLHIFASGSEMA